MGFNGLMSRCKTCRKHEVMDSWDDKLCEWLIYKLFPKTLMDFQQDKYTQGFSDGYVMGRKHANEDYENYKTLLKT